MKKHILLYFSYFFIVTPLLSQPCSVSVDSLKGEYNGDCKKGKAEGKGTAVGIDSYKGNFKNGYPNGEGKYIWKNGLCFIFKEFDVAITRRIMPEDEIFDIGF